MHRCRQAAFSALARVTLRRVFGATQRGHPFIGGVLVGTKSRLFASSRERRKLIILGTGWAGYRTLLDIDINKYDVDVVGPRNHFLFTPLLTSTTVGTLEFRGVIEPVRTARKRLNYLQANCTNIDFEKQVVTARSFYAQRDTDDSPPLFSELTIPYDELVISVGAQANTFGVPGVEKYCFFLRQVSDARLIRQRILECFERASSPTIDPAERNRLLHFVVVGGGPTSVEFTAELHDFLKQDVHKWYPELEKYVGITLVEAGKTLLSSFDQSLSEYTMRLFAKRNIDVRTGVSVREVRRHEIILSDGATMPFGMGVWSTGLSPSPLVQQLSLPKDRSGRLLVDNQLRVKGLSNVYAAGDCAAFDERPLAQTAQAAEQMGKYLARALNIKAKAGSSAVPEFRYQHRGMLAYVGGWRALVDNPVVKSSGFLSWLLWNAAYITKLVSVKNKIMIPMYWFKSFVFGRDIARF